MRAKNLFLALILSACNLNSAPEISILTDAAGGHKGVTGSLIRGLTQNNISHNHNPPLNQIAQTVVVLADTIQLRRAIELKQQGRIKKLLAGPNLVTRADDCNSLVASKEIDAYLVPSRWCLVAYEEVEPRLIGRINLWPAGIDVNQWNPIFPKAKTGKMLIYLKYQPYEFASQVESLVKQYGYDPIIIEYGKYLMPQYYDLLNHVDAVIFLSRSESQGLALAEAWAMDVPTLAWNPKELIDHGRIYSEVSSCPLLTLSTGLDWKNLNDLEDQLKNFEELGKKFAPRKWVLDHLTDKISAQILLKIIEAI